MIELLIFLAFIYILEFVLKIFISDYDKCYSEMEDTGTAVFGCCRGLTDRTRHTGYLQENCVDCPYLVLFAKKGGRGKGEEINDQIRKCGSINPRTDGVYYSGYEKSDE